MFGFQKTEFVRIFLVKESHCDKDMYVLKPFDDDSINEEMNPDEIYEEFSYLIEYVFNYCGGYFVIDDESTVDGDGNILLNDTEITGEKVEFIIPDIRDRIITKTDKPIYCVVFGYDPMEYTCTGYIWVVVEPTRTEYRG
ncbi:MAG: hypothetical protein FWC43_07980 [Planctomycetaceae bacterium]|nr:hypothetical protein [Planctomycetaceae bacterium]